MIMRRIISKGTKRSFFTIFIFESVFSSMYFIVINLLESVQSRVTGMIPDLRHGISKKVESIEHHDSGE